MFNQEVKRIGFPCKIVDDAGKSFIGINTKATTITWLNNQPKQTAITRLQDLAEYNMDVLYKQMIWLSLLPSNQRMFRIGSDILTAYTHPDWSWFYRYPTTVKVLEEGFSKIGDIARKYDIRLSFHPGQFCVLASEHFGVVENSIKEFEYHADMARWMGYGVNFQDFKCNVHIGGKRGVEGILHVLPLLSDTARNIITIENDEFKHGVDETLELGKHLALVLDIHHHWIRTGEYFDARDYSIIQESWRGVRPTIHYSCSREEHLDWHSPDNKPDLLKLFGAKYTRSQLRAHSDFYWNTALNMYAASFLDQADIMLESKMKNLSQAAIAKEFFA